MLTDAAREALLREVPVIDAALGRLLEALDESGFECPACHVAVKTAFRDYSVAQPLKGMRTKLRRWKLEAESASNGPKGRPPEVTEDCG